MAPAQTSPTGTSPRLNLICAAPDDDGGQSGTRLSAGTAAGRMLRLRRGIYLPMEDWLTAAPWVRYETAVAASALHAPSRIFCREAALVLHGVPLAVTPRSVAQRTDRRGDVGRRPQPSMLGAAERRALPTLMARWSAHLGVPLKDDDFATIPLRRHEPMVPDGLTREQVRASGEQLRGIRLGSEALEHVQGPAEGYLVEPLGMVLADMLPRMTFTQAVTAADAVVAGRSGSGTVPSAEELLDAQRWIRSRRARERYRAVWEFADARSGSPGESVSRAVIRDLGFEPPDLQVPIDTDGGRRYADFGWRDGRILGEFDGRTKYVDSYRISGLDPGEVIWQEKRRQEALEREGRVLARWGWHELKHPQILLAKGVPRRR